MEQHELDGRFHAHLTILTDKPNFECPKGWKVTIILLRKGDVEQQDIMITKHFVKGTPKTPKTLSIYVDCERAKLELEYAGHKVIRTKIEHESLPTFAPSEAHYRECHVKIKKPVGTKLIAVPGFVESNNPMEVTDTHSTVFLNARFYSGSVNEVDETVDSMIDQVRKLNPLCTILEAKKESAIYDSNLNLDKWWA